MTSSVNSRVQIARMFKNSHTKLIAPIVTYGLITAYLESGDPVFTDSRIKHAYKTAVAEMKSFLGHDVHIGAKYYDAYGSRMSRYGVLEQIAHLHYKLLHPYTTEASDLRQWLPSQINPT